MSKQDHDDLMNRVFSVGLKERSMDKRHKQEWAVDEMKQLDPADRAHYMAHPSGVEMSDIAGHFNFCLGNVIKYIWRADLKGAKIEDLKKARWYLDREIRRLEESK